MGLPILFLAGNAGAGKDYWADKIAQTYGGTKISLADPIKRFAQAVFRVPADILWGPSELRSSALVPEDLGGEEATRLWEQGLSGTWNYGRDNIFQSMSKVETWFLKETGEFSEQRAHELRTWFHKFVANKDLTVREFLQLFGTEYGRQKMGKDVWFNLATKSAVKILREGLYHDKEFWGLHRGWATESISKAAPSCVIVPDARFRSEVFAAKEMGAKVVLIESNHNVGTKDTHSSETELATIPRSWYDAIYVNDKSNPNPPPFPSF